jgi:hypothetical protein
VQVIAWAFVGGADYGVLAAAAVTLAGAAVAFAALRPRSVRERA